MKSQTKYFVKCYKKSKFCKAHITLSIDASGISFYIAIKYKYPDKNSNYFQKYDLFPNPENTEQELNKMVKQMTSKNFIEVDEEFFKSASLNEITELFYGKPEYTVYPQQYRIISQEEIPSGKFYYMVPKISGVYVCIRKKNNIVEIYNKQGVYQYKHLISDSFFNTFFDQYPNEILEGCLYLDHVSVENVIKICSDNSELTKQLKLYITDIADEKMKIRNRSDLLKSISCVTENIKVVSPILTDMLETNYEYHYYKMLDEGFDGLLLKNNAFTYFSDGDYIGCIAPYIMKQTFYDIVGYDIANNILEIIVKLHNDKNYRIQIQNLDFRNFLVKNIDNLIGNQLNIKYSYLNKNQEPVIYYTNKIYIKQNEELFFK